jgi:hypothetical protein
MMSHIIIKLQINNISEPTIQFLGLLFCIISSALTSQSDSTYFGIIFNANIIPNGTRITSFI